MTALIGITLDAEEPGHYATVPWYALRKNYCQSTTKAGGICLPLPHDMDAINTYVSKIDGLILTGGGFDIPPEFYGETTHHPTVTLKPERTHFELAMAGACLDQGKPILGICGGMQLINVLCGGTLIQDIPSQCPKALPHKQSAPYDKAFHAITLLKEGGLYALNNASTAVEVNSVHHQAIDRIGHQLRVTAVAPDGIIEGIEYTGDTFCVGVQWHPEYEVIPLDARLFTFFVAACAQRSSR